MLNLKVSKLMFLTLVFIGCAVASASVSQDRQPAKRKDCERKCFVGLKDPRAKIKFTGEKVIALLDGLDASIEKETDPEKKKELQNRRADLLEKHETKAERFCEDMCAPLSE